MNSFLVMTLKASGADPGTGWAEASEPGVLFLFYQQTTLITQNAKLFLLTPPPILLSYNTVVANRVGKTDALDFQL